MIEQGTVEWLELRKGKVTASRVADIMAKTKTSTSTSRGNYLIELALQRVTGKIQESFINDAMQWGMDQESSARVAYEVKTNNFVDKIAFFDHPSIHNFGCSPDGLVGDDGLVEIKCPNSATHWGYLKDGKAPAKYIMQIQTQLACTCRAWCDFVSYDPRMPERSQLLIVRVMRDDELIKTIETEVKKFLDEVETEVKLMRGE